MNTQDYPEHTAPEPPAGMKWEYRGAAWSYKREATYYYIGDKTPSNVLSGLPSGGSGTHYFEAVPILTEQKPSIDQILEALCELRDLFAGMSANGKAMSSDHAFHALDNDPDGTLKTRALIEKAESQAYWSAMGEVHSLIGKIEEGEIE